MTETPTPEIKMVAIDLDGTLLNSDHQVSERNAHAVQKLVDKGIEVILATGKTRAAATALIERFNIDSPGIFNQGLVVYNADGTIRHQQTLDAGIVRRIVTFAEDRGYEVNLYSGTRIMVRPDFDKSLITTYGEPEPEVTGPLVNQLADTSINKITLYGTPRKINALRWQLEAQFDGDISVTRAHIPTMIEVVPLGANKGKSLFTIAKEMKIKPENILAIGDGENDIDMVNMAGIGVAMENASDKVKEVAQYITSNNDNDGVAQAIEKYFPDIKPTPEIKATEVMPAATLPTAIATEEQAEEKPTESVTTESGSESSDNEEKSE